MNGSGGFGSHKRETSHGKVSGILNFQERDGTRNQVLTSTRFYVGGSPQSEGGSGVMVVYDNLVREMLSRC